MGLLDEQDKFKASRLAEVLEKVTRIIPGIGHYQDKEKIRNWDKELRLYLAEMLEGIRRSVEESSRMMAETGELKHLKKMNDINNKLDRVRDTIKFASYGYSGVFDPKKIKEPELLRHYEFDLEVVEQAKKIEAALKNLKDAVHQRLEVSVPIENMIKEIEDLEKFFQKRHRYLCQEDVS